tara:strand:+ start:2040 stop:2303 length:264 start_codon:yes stop_codon:yes gene_type:complete
MKEKKQKATEKKETIYPTCRTCSDCNDMTDDFYCISTNRGSIFKCNACYELWCVRETRANVSRTGRTSDLDTIKDVGQNLHSDNGGN